MDSYDWADIAFGNKKPLKNLDAIFIAAPRDISAARFIQMIKKYLPAGNIILGISKETYVIGLEDQPHFKMLGINKVRNVIDKISSHDTRHKVSVLTYAQRDLKYVFEKLSPKRVVLVNGSWYQAFHYKPEFYSLVKAAIPYEMVSPFTNEKEAISYCKAVKFTKLPAGGEYSLALVRQLLKQAAKQSYDFAGYQTAAALVRKNKQKYRLLAIAHNKVVPYETYAMHHGSLREKNFSPVNDLNFYDTNHAEVELLIKAQNNKNDLNDASLFINLLPCPTCARMLSETAIKELIYYEEHTSGYAVKMLEAAGKTVRRLGT